MKKKKVQHIPLTGSEKVAIIVREKMFKGNMNKLMSYTKKTNRVKDLPILKGLQVKEKKYGKINYKKGIFY